MTHGEPHSDPAHETARVLKFERRRRAGPPPRAFAPFAATPDRKRNAAGSASPAADDVTDGLASNLADDDLARYELARYELARSEEDDAQVDYRHRMLMNVIAVAIVTALVGAGVWIADTIAAMEKVQDCAMQGRQNCAPIEVPLKH